MGIFNLLRLVSPLAQFASFTVGGAAASCRDGDSGQRPLCAEGAPGCRDRCDGFTGAMGFQPNYR